MNGTIVVDWETRYYLALSSLGVLLLIVIALVHVRPRVVKRTATL